MISSINFKARYINSDIIQIRKPFSDIYTPVKADYVELDLSSEADLDCVTKIGEKWQHGCTFANTIARDMRLDSLNNYNNKEKDESLIFHETKGKYFAIVKEGTSKNLSYTDILGIAKLTEKTSQLSNLDFIQVIPKYLNDGSGFFKPQIKNIGTALLKNICRTCRGKNITLEAIRTTNHFYEKFGFKKIRNTNKMIRKAKRTL